MIEVDDSIEETIDDEVDSSWTSVSRLPET